MAKYLISAIVLLCGLLVLALLTMGTRVEIDLNSGRLRSTKEVVGFPLQRIVTNNFSNISQATGAEDWRTARFFKWWNTNYSPQYSFSWTVRIVQELGEVLPQMDQETSAQVKNDIIKQFKSNDYEGARALADSVNAMFLTNGMPSVENADNNGPLPGGAL